MARRRPTGRKGNASAPARPRRWNPALLVLLAAALALKLVVMTQLQDHPLIQPDGGVDSAAYVRLAQQVLGGDFALGPGLYYLSPLYIYFLAAGLWLTDSFAAIRTAQCVLGTIAVWCIFDTARLWFGRRAAWIAAALAAVTGVFTFYEILILQASLDTFLTAAALWALARALAERERAVDGGNESATTFRTVFARAIRWGFLTGILWGVQALNRPNVAIAAGGVLVASLCIRRWRVAAAMAIGMTIAVAPVVARNAVVSHQFALSSSHGGLNFYIGNNAAATGQYAAVPGVRGNVEGQSEDTRRVAEQAVGHPLTDAEVSRYFTSLALDWMRANPMRAAGLFARKLALVFNARHQWLDFSYPYYAYDTGSILAFLVVGPWLLVPLGFAGMVLGMRPAGPAGQRRAAITDDRPEGSTTRDFVVWSAFVPFYAIGVAVFFVAERYRLPVFVPLCICAGGAVDILLEALAKRSPVIERRSSTAAGLAAAAIGVVLIAWPFPLNNGRYDERLMLSKALMNRHDYGAAADELQRALDLQPGNTVTEFNLGIALVSAGRDSDGLSHLRHAVDAHVPIPGARYALANAMLTTGDRDGAVALLRTFYPEPAETAESCFQVGLLALNAGAPLVAERYLQRALQLKPGWPEATQLLQQLGR